jgi:hypothetical protein
VTQIKDAFTEHQLKRWIRPDAHRFIRPDWRRFVRPGFERDYPFDLYERKFSPTNRATITGDGRMGPIPAHRATIPASRASSFLLKYHPNAKQNASF